MSYRKWICSFVEERQDRRTISPSCTNVNVSKSHVSNVTDNQAEHQCIVVQESEPCVAKRARVHNWNLIASYQAHVEEGNRSMIALVLIVMLQGIIMTGVTASYHNLRNCNHRDSCKQQDDQK